MAWKTFHEGGEVHPAELGNSYLLPPPMTVTELNADVYPNLAERIVRVVRDVVAIVLMVLAGLFLILALRTVTAIGDGIEQLTPEPTVSGCPFGDTECGG